MADKRMVLVEWRDAQDYSGAWVDQKEAEDFGGQECVIRSLGFVVSKTAKYITLAADWHEAEGDYGRVTKVPIGMILTISDVPTPVTPPDLSPPFHVPYDG